MRAYRLIFRLDFARPNFDIVDNPGTVMRLLDEMGKEFWAEFQDSTANRSVGGQKKDRGGGVSREMKVEPLSMHLVYDTAKGFDLANPEGDDDLQTLLKGMHTLCNHFKIDELRRAGIRFSILAKQNYDHGESVKRFLNLINDDVANPIRKHLGKMEDVGIRIDGRATDKLAYHLQFGPYAKEEAVNFFAEEIHDQLMENDENNIFFDIDVYEEAFALTVSPSKWAKIPMLKAYHLTNEVCSILASRA